MVLLSVCRSPSVMDARGIVSVTDLVCPVAISFMFENDKYVRW